MKNNKIEINLKNSKGLCPDWRYCFLLNNLNEIIILIKEKKFNLEEILFIKLNLIFYIFLCTVLILSFQFTICYVNFQK